MKKVLCIIIVLLVAIANVASANLLAHWTFDTDFTDSAGTFDMSAAGGAGIDSDGGKIGGAVSLSSASSQYASVSFTENALFTPGEDYTVMAWYKLDVADITGSNRYMVFETGVNYTASYGLKNDTTLGDIGDVWTRTGTTAKNMTFSQGANQIWHHIAVTYDHSTGVFNAYVDGVLANTMTKTGTLMSSTAFYVGTYRTHDARYFKGLIDDVAVFDNIVSVDDIEYYAAGNAVPEPATICLLTLGSLLFVKRRS